MKSNIYLLKKVSSEIFDPNPAVVFPAGELPHLQLCDLSDYFYSVQLPQLRVTSHFTLHYLTLNKSQAEQRLEFLFQYYYSILRYMYTVTVYKTHRVPADTQWVK